MFAELVQAKRWAKNKCVDSNAGYAVWDQGSKEIASYRRLSMEIKFLIRGSKKRNLIRKRMSRRGSPPTYSGTV
jgi:hypothetical protein